MTIIKTSRVKRLERGDGIVSVPLITRGSDSAAVLTTGMSTYPRGTSAPMHFHNCDEQVTLVAGKAEVEIEGVVTGLEPFDSTYIRAGLKHAFRNAGDEPMTILWIYPTQVVTRTRVATGQTVEHLSQDDTLNSGQDDDE